MASDSPSPTPGTAARFGATQWAMVLIAGGSPSPKATAALDQLCRTYWYPIYAFVRRRGHPPHDAQDLTQGFFAHLLQHDWLDEVGPEKGRFRTYLIRCLTNYLTNEWKKATGPTRRPPGGILPLEPDVAETRYAREPADDATPDKLFQRQWVTALVDQAKARLRSECAEKGSLALFEKLEPDLGDRTERESIADAAVALNMSQGAFRTASHRLRARFGEILREAVAETLDNPSPADVNDEIRSLFSAWG